MGFAMAPMQDGQVVPPAEFNAWPESEQQEVQAAIEELEKELEETLRALPRLEKEQRDAVRDARSRDRALRDRPADRGVPRRSSPTCRRCSSTSRRSARTCWRMSRCSSHPQAAGEEAAQAARVGSLFDRYEVNVLVTQADGNPAPRWSRKLHPTLGNLVGRIEYIAVQGALVTNFRLIKAGRLHRANGGAICSTCATC